MINTGHLMPSTLRTIQSQPGSEALVGVSCWHISFLCRIGHWFSSSKQAWLVSLSIRKKKKKRVSLGGLQRRQKAPVFISVAGVFISFDTSYVFVVVVGGKGASPVLWEVYPRRGRMRKALCEPKSSRGVLRQPLLHSRAVEAAPGLSNYSWGRLFKGTLAARRSNTMLSRDLWTSCSFFCQMCLPFVFCGGWHPSMPEPSHAEGACGRDRLLERETGCVGNGRAPGRSSDASAAFVELHLLFTSCRFHWYGDGNCERRLWLGSAGACR